MNLRYHFVCFYERFVHLAGIILHKRMLSLYLETGGSDEDAYKKNPGEF